MRTRHFEREDRAQTTRVEPADLPRPDRVETRKDRRALARDAGLGQLSLTSILAGTLAAYGAVAVLLAIAGGVAAAINDGTDFSSVGRTELKVGAGIVVGVVLLISYFYGGYVAGRMARRSGARNGLGVFVLGVVIALVVGVLVKQAGWGSTFTTDLRNVGAPTTWHDWRDVGTVAGIASLAAMLLGSLGGGLLGERWHTKLLARALDPNVGPEAALSRQAASQAAEADDAHLAAEERVARSSGEHFTTPAAAGTAAVEARQGQREARLAEERRGLVDEPAPDATVAADDYRPDNLASTTRTPNAPMDTTDNAVTGDRVSVPDDGTSTGPVGGSVQRPRTWMDRLLHR